MLEFEYYFQTSFQAFEMSKAGAKILPKPSREDDRI